MKQSDLIDLRSDTVTRPTPAMRRAMAEAEVGDDVYGEDPTVNRLERRAAEILGKEAGLYVPSGTMGNTIAVKLHTRHGQEVICEARSHLLNYELAMLAWFSGCVARPIQTEDGILRWEAIQKEICPKVKGARRTLFFDLADPEKRTKEDIQRALKLIVKFEKHFNVILGLNEKECHEIAKVLGIKPRGTQAEELTRTAMQIAERVEVGTLVVHPVSYALAVSQGVASVVEGPFVKRPKITTGAGDHFNSGFCLGKLLGLDNAQAVLTGVTTSGSYVRTAQSPTVKELIAMLRKWPKSSEE